MLFYIRPTIAEEGEKNMTEIPNQVSEGIFDGMLDEVDDTPIADESDFHNELETESDKTEDSSVIEETVQSEPFLKVKYLQEEKDLTRDEALEYAQKGMDYDRIREKYDALSPYKDVISNLEALAKRNGMSLVDYAEKLKNVEKEYEVNQEFDNLKQEYPDAPDEVIKELAEKRIFERSSTAAQKEANVKLQQENAMHEKVQRDIDMFFAEHPEFKGKGPEALDPKVLEFVSQGYTLLEAYNKWSSIEQTPVENIKGEFEKRNELNRSKSIGSTDSQPNEGESEYDMYMEGFNSANQY